MMGEVLTHQGELKSALSHLKGAFTAWKQCCCSGENRSTLFQAEFPVPAKAEFTKLIELSFSSYRLLLPGCSES